ncbi:ribosome-associated ATPase/putative transporter RbbA [Nitrospirillum pindoramense]|uniref:Ribosome-dependent ATPase n=1 Tax=Nitrospirillum amazonense TaxID=28077 RepID=A0A560HBZ9_9PROT|nr:ribosome-associated ATPase/putative transporter RbbA [Nitrospirillum amazonense]TWB43631.1 ribosome-dependent ATPase [Nitrospirillum amazonense]
MTGQAPTAVRVAGVSHRYGRTGALAAVDLTVPAGGTLALIGPDGVGKSTLLGLIAGAKRLQDGTLQVLGGDMARGSDRRRLQPRVAFMPQGLGRNLYPDLSVRENLEFFGKLFGQGPGERSRRIHHLLAATGLAPFPDRPAGKLSGGMRQKLGLCCALIHDPDLLILDEPTTGVDPLSRRQFWDLIDSIRAERPGMTLLVATSYMDEAQRFERAVMMDGGRILADGTPAELMARTGTADLEAAFVALLPPDRRGPADGAAVPPLPAGRPIAIEARGLTRRFGDFVAVDAVSFAIPKGEIFGFLGSNGCGKTTTMKMLTGLLPASAGTPLLFGQPVDPGDLATRQRVGYMAQSFSLYGDLSVAQNLDLHATLFGLLGAAADARVAEVVADFGLAPYLPALADSLPLGVRQRLSLAVSVLHKPEVLILDEPTSGVDPVARDAFWRQLTTLSRDQGVTIFVSTHYMNEAARCDRVAFMQAGRVLAVGAPEALRQEKQASSLDDAFVAYMRENEPEEAPPETAPAALIETPAAESGGFSPRRLSAYALREGLELRRDPVRLTVALLGTLLLMLVFGFGINFDVENLRFAVLDRDHSPLSRTVAEAFSSSRYFQQTPPATDAAEGLRRLQANDVALVVDIPPDFGRDVKKGTPAEVAVRIDGAMPFRAETIQGYVAGLFLRLQQDLATEAGVEAAPGLSLVPRFRYNQAFRSVDAMVPCVIGLLLVFIPSILTALGVVREKELGSITNLYVTPVSRLEFLLGKQLPYIAIAFFNYAVMVVMALVIFHVPLKGSLAGLSLGALAYVMATTALGLLVSCFVSTQTAAVFGTAIATMLPAIQFSGMMQPVSTLSGMPHLLGTLFPTTYFVKTVVGAFTKGLSLAELTPFILSLLAFFPVLVLTAAVLLRKQEA